MLQKYPIVSMFVVPTQLKPDLKSQLHSPLSQWQGMYFVKQGLFQGAILKFELSFPLNYPKVKPTLRFLSPSHIFHPLVHPKSGEVNLDYDFKNWKPGKHWALSILHSLKKMLHLEEYFSLSREGGSKMAINKEAFDLFQNNFEVYLEKV
jgi:ubiquitin-protein ligase